MNSAINNTDVFRQAANTNQITYNIKFNLPFPGLASSSEASSPTTATAPIIKFHLPIPGSAPTSDTYSAAPKIKFHLPIPGSASTSDDSTTTTVCSDTNFVLAQLQFGLLFLKIQKLLPYQDTTDDCDDDDVSFQFEDISSVQSEEVSDAVDNVPSPGEGNNNSDSFDYTALAGLLINL